MVKTIWPMSTKPPSEVMMPSVRPSRFFIMSLLLRGESRALVPLVHGFAANYCVYRRCLSGHLPASLRRGGTRHMGLLRPCWVSSSAIRLVAYGWNQADKPHVHG